MGTGDIMYVMFKYFTGPTCENMDYRWNMYQPLTIRYCNAFGDVYNTLTFDGEKETATLTIKNGADKVFKIKDAPIEIKKMGLLNGWKPTYLRYTDEELSVLEKDVEPFIKDDVWKLK